MDKNVEDMSRKVDSNDGPSSSHISIVQVGREHLADAIPPHESYEGRHRYDPGATWTAEEERKLVRKTDLYLLSWICVMVIVLNLFRPLKMLTASMTVLRPSA
jgi:hypothetical protein